MNKAANPVPTGYGLVMDDRKRIQLTGVTDVESFDETQIALHTQGGRLIITGKELHVSSLQLENGRLHVEGSIDAIVYDGAPGRRRGWLSRGQG